MMQRQVRTCREEMVARILCAGLTAVLFALAISCGLHGSDARQPCAIPALAVDSIAIESSTYADALAELAQAGAKEGVEPALFQQLKGALAAALSADRGGRLVAKVPPGTAGAVTDLSVEGLQAKTLVWHYRNTGDYNQDGIVSIMDITPLAVYFNRAVGTHPTVEVVDGNEDGFVTIADITPLAAGFFNQVSCYSIEGSDQADSGFSEIGTVGLAAATGEGRLLLSYELGFPEYRYYRVLAHDDEGNAGDSSNTVYIEAVESPEIVEVWPRSGLTNQEVEFIAVVSGSEPLTYLWDFGGGASPNTSALREPTVTLGEPGEYAASLRVSNAVGEEAFGFTLIVIDPADLPEVQSVSPTEGVEGELVQFAAVVTGAAPFSFSWHFGGGGDPDTSTDESPEVTLGAEGEYDCSVKVENKCGEHTLFFALTVHPTGV